MTKERSIKSRTDRYYRDRCYLTGDYDRTIRWFQDNHFPEGMDLQERKQEARKIVRRCIDGILNDTTGLTIYTHDGCLACLVLREGRPLVMLAVRM